MLEKIISAGKFLVEKAALDAAIQLGMSHGGWTDEPQASSVYEIPYQLQVVDGCDYQEAIDQNIAGSDGTLIITEGSIPDDSRFNPSRMDHYNRLYLYVDYQTHSAFAIAGQISDWLNQSGIEILHVTSSEVLHHVDVYKMTLDILKTAYHMTFFNTGIYDHLPDFSSLQSRMETFLPLPKTINDAADALITRLTFKEKTKFAAIHKDQLKALSASMRDYIKTEFRLRSDSHQPMMTSFQTDDIDDVALKIVETVWEKLQTSNNLLRIIK